MKKIKFLKIPKRPDWKNTSDKNEQEIKENEAFLQWRRELQKVEENFPQAVVTPYEKNLEVWKQLWRTVEKSDIVI